MQCGIFRGDGGWGNFQPPPLPIANKRLSFDPPLADFIIQTPMAIKVVILGQGLKAKYFIFISLTTPHHKWNLKSLNLYGRP